MMPVVQTSLMSSVYATVVMSFERYLRLCRVRAMTRKVSLGKEKAKSLQNSFKVMDKQQMLLKKIPVWRYNSTLNTN